jgi:hypothetical protein
VVDEVDLAEPGAVKTVVVAISQAVATSHAVASPPVVSQVAQGPLDREAVIDSWCQTPIFNGDLSD